ncbi:hypothetical protein OCK74_01610 [Chitinophagaceae bacterium LB-8]|uniref:Uncharacterized protein n=1 Tax=Paraflavisolibacter caeni TaxID=2982496 RepID=A0A9X2XT34_9BACT|nr:hypothetical protein [Paraflavisolibacter caeni]MCU7547786.1 hypothetical protein [Paraflavisolibacter caeni]
MDLLKYEFMKSAQGSINDLIGQLVRGMRHIYYNVTIDQYSASLPELQEIEQILQREDQELGREPRNYLKEILEELEAESKLESKLLEEIERSAKTIVSALYEPDFSLEDFGYDFKKSEATYWLEFYGYKKNKGVDSSLLIVRDVFKSICYKHGIIFIDSTLDEE